MRLSIINRLQQSVLASKIVNRIRAETETLKMSFFALYEPLAQSVEHLTFNQGVRGSIPRWYTTHIERTVGLEAAIS